MNSFDVIVIGVGSMGSSACYYLSKKGYTVLGIEQFDITHEFGSHAGQSRIIRIAYFEHSDYVPLLQRAYENFEHLEEESKTQVFFKTGLVYFGETASDIMKGIHRSAELYNIPLQYLTATEIKKKFPQFHLPENFEGIFEPQAGFLTPEKIIKLYTDLATKKGACINIHEKVLEWKKQNGVFNVITSKDRYQCKKLVITAGAWAGKLIPALKNTLKITRQFVAWIEPTDQNNFSLHHFPCWLIADDKKPGAYYGFPMLPTEKFGEPAGLKLAHHYPYKTTDPDAVDRSVTMEDEETVKYALDKYFPGTFKKFLAKKTCLYANTPDENFIIDKLPGYDDVTIACGFSGHGFKFVSVVGEILSDLATEGKTNLPIGFLKAGRFS